MEFVGNPGTAKTTVARIMAGILKEVGLLTSNEMVEVGRADLIAHYEGQTEDKVKKVFERAKGKALFIDEAYSPVENWESAYGDEAINTIVQETENNRDDTLVIFAGYPDKMEQFFSRNPGFRSRVPFTIRFEDYTSDEMEQIAELEAKRRGFYITDEAKKKIRLLCENVENQSELGNGRFCRNLVENAILSYSMRLYGEDMIDTQGDFYLVEEDFELPKPLKDRKSTTRLGFRTCE